MLREILHINTKGIVLSDFKTSLRSQFRVDQQVLHLFVINFDHGDHDLELHGGGGTFANTIENFIAGDWNNTNISSVADLN